MFRAGVIEVHSRVGETYPGVEDVVVEAHSRV